MSEIISRELVISAGKKRMAGRLWTPREPGRRPAVILSHGYNGCHADLAAECAMLAEAGLTAFAFDFCGGSTRALSSGRSTDMTILTEKQDLLDVLAHVSAMDEVDAGAVFLLGASQGGLVTALAAEEAAQPVRGMALIYPAFCIPDDWRPRWAKREDIPDTLTFWELTLGRGYFEAIREMDPYAQVGGFAGPVLVVQGDRDGIVSVEVARRAAARYAAAEVVILPGEAHGFTPEGTRAAMDRVIRMIRACCP